MSSKIFLIAWHEDFITAIERYIRFVFPQWSRDQLVEQYVVSQQFSFDDVLGTYGAIADFIESRAGPFDLRNSMAILDLPLPELVSSKVVLNPLSITEQKKFPQATFVSLLALTFPEVKWTFFRPGSANAQTIHEYADHWVSADVLGQALTTRADRTTLFDPSGLRNYIRRRIKQDPETSSLVKALSLRKKLCAALDDEESYAFLHAYLAYRLGYRCHLVTTEAMMENLFKQMNGAEGGDGGRYEKVLMTFEDIFLNFSDRISNEPHLSNLPNRDKFYAGLRTIKHRIFVTSGHKHIEWYRENQKHIVQMRAEQKKVRTIYKPSGGIYNILKSGNLLGQFWRRRTCELKQAKPSPLAGGGHSAPGRLLVIAERLINRAERILSEARTVQDCLHGATLALEAQELLACRTPTTSLQAVAVRHQLEAKAECMFYGVGYNKDVKNRLQEIEHEVNAVAEWFHPSIRNLSALNARMSIVTQVMRILREFGQFDEEQACLNHLRKLHRRWSLNSNPWWGVFYPLRWYIETLVGSFPLFIAALLSWPVVFGIISWQIKAYSSGESPSPPERGIQAFSDHITHAFIVFFGLQPSAFPASLAAQILSVSMILMGFLHLGIFVSHLYTLISRR